jgi:hypothetical protein
VVKPLSDEDSHRSLLAESRENWGRFVMLITEWRNRLQCLYSWDKADVVIMRKKPVDRGQTSHSIARSLHQTLVYPLHVFSNETIFMGVVEWVMKRKKIGVVHQIQNRSRSRCGRSWRGEQSVMLFAVFGKP